MSDLRAKSVPSTYATYIHLYTYRGRAYTLGMSSKISIHTDHETWTGTPSELRSLFVSMIPTGPDLGQLRELAAVALGCESPDLIITRAGERPVYE
ncbi:hypothetical protein FRC0513_00740 [Corynebacterium diphtheriae]|nr:hypothetical protein FRC0356_00712 [Corynebacterium diphtheriae]CAB0987154.1 hypothetical protein FRC0513_00740 [Corynebacterium diphtheriae]